MKYTGMHRPVDELGRVVIPKEIRKTLNISVKDILDIFVDGNSIIMQKSTGHCVICGSAEDLSELEGRYICRECTEKIKNM